MNGLKCIKTLFVSSIVLFATSCGSPKDVVYLQGIEAYDKEHIAEKYQAYIHKDDLLAIMVNSRDAELAVPFNLPLTNYVNSNESYDDGTILTQQRLLGYLVDEGGYIDFPVLGRIKVEGLTRNELRDLIKNRLVGDGLLKDPIVSVQFLNFRISVMGEVVRPGSFVVSGDRITLLQALSMAGDLTIYGRRDRVAVIRENKGERTVLYHDLRSKDIFNSPCYYLQQNDIVYVEPNKRKAQQSQINQNNSASVWISVVSALVSAATLVVTIVSLSK